MIDYQGGGVLRAQNVHPFGRISTAIFDPRYNLTSP